MDGAPKAAAGGFPKGRCMYVDVGHMVAAPPSMEAYYRAWVQQVLADGRFTPGIYVHKANAESIYNGVQKAYRDMNASGSASFWLTTSTGFLIDKSPQDVGFPRASGWQGVYEGSQTS